jgi:seryl-tRNA synthetase
MDDFAPVGGTDFARGAKVTGSKFYFTVGDHAEQEFSLLVNMLNYHVHTGYTFVVPPYLVKREVAEMAGILPRFEGDFYETTDGLVLIPTAETALVGMHSWEIIPEEALPLRYVAFSPCFRREAGAGGARDSGLRRVHQFHKIELFVVCKPEDSESWHKEMIEHVSAMLQAMLGDDRVRRVELSEDDRAPWSNSTWDLEVRCGDEWLEVSSISNTGENQSKKAQVRYRPTGGGKPVKCHLLNGSGVAMPRLLLALRDKEAAAPEA